MTTIIDNINVFFGKWAFQNLSYFSHMKTPVLLLHGALGSAAMLEPLATQLQTADMPVRMMNFPGHGGLPLPESFSMPDFIQAVDEYTADWMPFKVFGYSMGGYVALLLAAMRPLRVEAVATLGTKFDWTRESAGKETARLNPTLMLEKIPAFVRVLSTRHGTDKWETVVNHTAGLLTRLGESPDLYQARLAQIICPVFIGRGSLDTGVTRKESEAAANAIPHGQYIELLDVKHPLEQVSEAILTDYLKKTILAL